MPWSSCKLLATTYCREKLNLCTLFTDKQTLFKKLNDKPSATAVTIDGQEGFCRTTVWTSGLLSWSLTMFYSFVWTKFKLKFNFKIPQMECTQSVVTNGHVQTTVRLKKKTTAWWFALKSSHKAEMSCWIVCNSFVKIFLKMNLNFVSTKLWNITWARQQSGHCSYYYFHCEENPNRTFRKITHYKTWRCLLVQTKHWGNLSQMKCNHYWSSSTWILTVACSI